MCRENIHFKGAREYFKRWSNERKDTQIESKFQEILDESLDDWVQCVSETDCDIEKWILSKTIVLFLKSLSFYTSVSKTPEELEDYIYYECEYVKPKKHYADEPRTWERYIGLSRYPTRCARPLMI